MARWMLKRTSADINYLAKNANITVTTAKILANRGIKNIVDIKRFLSAREEDLHDPMAMKDMDKGTDIIRDSILHKEKIVIYGDYDADGVTSTVIMYKALKACDANVGYHIPNRETEGYGLSKERLRLLKEQGYNTVLTCDNGISAIEEIKLAKELGLKVVITDHHELPFMEENENKKYIIPEADAIINPKQQLCKYPFKLLCGAGISFKFAQALFRKMGIDEKEAYDYIEIACIGTICDVVDLVDENRIIAKLGLSSLSNSKNLGINTLLENLEMKDKKINSHTVGFLIGPCINATGRLETADLSVKLLLTDNKDEAITLSRELVALNKKRQDMTVKCVDEIISHIENSEINNEKVLVVYNENVHESIAGIVAGKIRERFNLPTIIITKGKEMPKGSGRSIEEYNLFEELIKCKDLLNKFGGHPMAAGLSIEEKNIPLLRKALNENCKLTKEDIIPKLRLEKQVYLEEIDENLVEEINRLEPFGKGNASPLLAEKNVFINNIQLLGREIKNTLKFQVCSKNHRKIITGICFGKVEEFEKMIMDAYSMSLEQALVSSDSIKLDLVYVPFINIFRNKKYLQMRIVDFRISK